MSDIVSVTVYVSKTLSPGSQWILYTKYLFSKAVAEHFISFLKSRLYNKLLESHVPPISDQSLFLSTIATLFDIAGLFTKSCAELSIVPFEIVFFAFDTPSLYPFNLYSNTM